MRRYQMAAGTSFMVIVLLYVAYLLDGLDWTGFVGGSALILFWVGAVLRPASAPASTSGFAIPASRCRS